MPSAAIDAPVRVWSARDQRIILTGHAIIRAFRSSGEDMTVDQLRQATGESRHYVQLALARLAATPEGTPDGYDDRAVRCVFQYTWAVTPKGAGASYGTIRKYLIRGAVRAKSARWMTGADGARKVVWR